MAKHSFKPARLAKQRPAQKHEADIVAVAYQKRNIRLRSKPVVCICIPSLEARLAPVVAQLIGSKLIMAGYDDQGYFSIYAKPLEGFSIGENKQIYYDLLQQLTPEVEVTLAFIQEQGGEG